MDRPTLGRTNLTVSRGCLGTMTFGAQVDQATAGAMVGYALERGINFIDTANVYNAGQAETILGQILKGRRHEFILATKVGGKMGEGPNESGLSHKAIAIAIEASLQRLQTDYVDLYYLHHPDPRTPLEESLEAMERLIRAGKVRYLAASNYASWQVCRMLWLAEKNAWQPVRVMQPMYNLIARGIEPEFLPMCREFGLAVAAYNPLAGGLLTGKHPAEAPLAGTRFERMPIYRDRYWHRASLEGVGDLSAIAGGAGRSLVSLALSWLLHHTTADCIILGASSLEQLKENLAAMEDGPLTPQTTAACDAVWRKLRGVSPQYNR